MPEKPRKTKLWGVNRMAFAMALAQGHTQSQAFIEAGGDPGKDETLRQRAHNLAKTPAIQRMVGEFKKDIEDRIMLGFSESVEAMREQVRGGADITRLDRTAAASLIGKWAGRDGKSTTNNVVILGAVSLIDAKTYESEPKRIVVDPVNPSQLPAEGTSDRLSDALPLASVDQPVTYVERFVTPPATPGETGPIPPAK